MRAVEAAGRDGKAIAWSAGDNRYHWSPSRTCARSATGILSKFPPQLRTLDVVLLHGFILSNSCSGSLPRP